MQVILLETIQNLGELGELANVKSGYARNFLIPQNKAKPATKANLIEFEKIKAELVKKAAASLVIAKEKQKVMQDVVCTIFVNASEEGKLFGSVNAADIVKSLKDNELEIEKRDVNMPNAIHYVGEYEVNVDLYTSVSVDIKVIVKANEQEEE